MSNFIALALANKHTTTAAALFFIAKVFFPALAIWLPNYKNQCDQTAGLLEGAAVAYGLLMAGDAKKVPPADPPTKP